MRCVLCECIGYGTEPRESRGCGSFLRDDSRRVIGVAGLDDGMSVGGSGHGGGLVFDSGYTAVGCARHEEAVSVV